MHFAVRLAIIISMFIALDPGAHAQQWRRYENFSGASFTSLEVSTIDPRIIVTTIQGSPLPLFTTNAGTTWHQFATLPTEWGSLRWMGLVRGTQQTIRVVFDKEIYETTNFGESYANVSTLPTSAVRNLLVHPTDNRYWFAWSSSSLFLRSTNEGGTWDTVQISKQTGMSGPIVSAAAPGRMYVEVRDTIFESADTGRTWQRFNHAKVETFGMDLLAADVSMADRLYAYFQGRLAVSTDRGRTWSDRSQRNLQGVQGISQSATRADVLYAWGTNLHRSTDRGMTWQTIDTTRTVRMAATLVNDELYVGCYQSGIFRATQDASAWTRLDKGINRLDIRSIIALTDKSWYVQGVNDVFTTSDAGETWSELTPVKYDQPSGGRVYSFDVARSNPSRMLGGTNSDIYRSTDGGETWLGANPRQNEPINAISIHPINPMEIVCGGLYNLKHSTDGGVTWTNDRTNNHRLVADIARNLKAPLHLLAAEESAVYSTRDGGVSWTKYEWNVGETNQLVADAKDSATFYAATASRVYITTNYGESWSTFGALGFGVSSLVQDSRNNDVFYATLQGGRGELLRYNKSTGTLDTLYLPGWENEYFSIRKLLQVGNTIVAGSTSGLLWFDPTPVSVHSEQQTLPALEIRPNPSRESITVQLPTNVRSVVTADVFDLQGQRISRTVASTDAEVRSLVIDVSALTTGPYMVRVLSGKDVYSSMFVKAR